MDLFFNNKDLLIPLIVAIPLLGSALTVMAGARNITTSVISSICLILSFVCAIGTMLTVHQFGEINYYFGGWIAPYGIEYKIDELRALIISIISVLSVVLLPYTLKQAKNEIYDKRRSLFYASYLLVIAGLLGMAATNDLFNIYVFLEISSLATYALIACGRNEHAARTSFNYLITGSVGATLFVLGIAVIYQITGTLNIDDIKGRLITTNYAELKPFALGLLLAGVMVKSAILPLHGWLISSYQRAPNVAASFLAAASTKVGLYVLLQMLFMFGVYESLFETNLDNILMVLGSAAIIYGSLAAIYQKDFRRLLAFSSVANIGYIILGLGIGNASGISASLIHFAAHAFAKSALFIVAGVLIIKTGKADISGFKGFSKRSIVGSAVLVLAGLSMIGIPSSAGFISKWLLVKAAFEYQTTEAAIAITFVIISGSLMAVAYIWKLVEYSFFHEVKESYVYVPMPAMFKASLWSLVAILFTLGLFAVYVIEFVEPVVEKFLIS